MVNILTWPRILETAYSKIYKNLHKRILYENFYVIRFNWDVLASFQHCQFLFEFKFYHIPNKIIENGYGSRKKLLSVVQRHLTLFWKKWVFGCDRIIRIKNVSNFFLRIKWVLVYYSIFLKWATNFVGWALPTLIPL